MVANIVGGDTRFWPSTTSGSIEVPRTLFLCSVAGLWTGVVTFGTIDARIVSVHAGSRTSTAGSGISEAGALLLILGAFDWALPSTAGPLGAHI